MSIRNAARGLALALALLIAASSRFRPQSGRSAPPSGRRSSRSTGHLSTAQKLLAAHNRERARDGLPPLRLNPRLNAAARAHADQMARVGRMAHGGLGDGEPDDRLQGVGYESVWSGENLAWNQPDVDTVVQAWMRSKDRRANILGHFQEMGGAVAFGRRNDPYWCVLFGTRSWE
ncbi:MAG: CAP domain-containing protein [Isosphaeraceae bacterium]